MKTDVSSMCKLAALSLVLSSAAQAAMTGGVVDPNNPAELPCWRAEARSLGT